MCTFPHQRLCDAESTTISSPLSSRIFEASSIDRIELKSKTILIEHSCADIMNPIDLTLRSKKAAHLLEEQPSGSTIQFNSRRLCRDGLTLATTGVGVKD
jgi:hypothetical protein